MKRIVVFASGGGSNFRAIAEACQKGEVNGKVKLLIANKPSIGALEIAKEFSISYCIISPEDSTKLITELEQVAPDIICLAGYLKKIPKEITEKFTVINIHPALLPKFGGKGMYGHFVHEAVLKAKETESGATIHYVNEKYDDGQIIAQKKVSVYENDTPEVLAQRVLEQEHLLYPEELKKLCL